MPSCGQRSCGRVWQDSTPPPQPMRMSRPATQVTPSSAEMQTNQLNYKLAARSRQLAQAMHTTTLMSTSAHECRRIPSDAADT